MAPRGLTPDLVVGIDFGMTCTGVAYSWGPEWPRPETIRHWPGKMIHELDNKVPTRVSYEKNDPTLLKSWGFLTSLDDRLYGDFFKLDLDPRFNSDDPRRTPVSEARRWFRDYMKGLHDHVVDLISNVMPHWKSSRIEFLFSVPTTWKDRSVVAVIEELLGEAGFGKDGLHHSKEIYLTEAEAAAVFASKAIYKKGDVLLIVDSGGGTTDVNVLRLDSSPGEPASMTMLGFVEGQSIGSTQINIGFQKMISERLQSIPELEGDSLEIAEQMTRGRFDGFKCGFGHGSSLDLPTIPVEVPGLTSNFNRPDLKIEDGMMRLERQELQELFDNQRDKMFRLIDEQLALLSSTHPTEKVSYIVMSGGFGSSPYIRQQLQTRYSGRNSSVPDSEVLKVNLVSEPQLAVTHGLVLNRIQEIRHNKEAFKVKCCRTSYGIVVRELYNPEIHFGESPYRDPFDKQLWVLSQIDWLIKQGEPIYDNCIKKRYKMKIAPGMEKSPWRIQIVVSDLPAKTLPKSLRTGEASIVCKVAAELSPSDLKLKNRHWYQLGSKKYYRADFFVHIKIGVVDLRFELLSRDGETCSRSEESIAVEWAPATEYPRPPSVALTAHVYAG